MTLNEHLTMAQLETMKSLIVPLSEELNRLFSESTCLVNQALLGTVREIYVALNEAVVICEYQGMSY